MTERDLITLREYLEQRLDYERSLVAQRFEMMEVALKLQAAEYERRFEILNHAHEAAVKEQARVLPRETFEQWKDDFGKWRGDTNTALGAMMNHGALIGATERRLTEIERLSNRVSGAILLLGSMGFAGVLGFLLSIARILGIVH